RAQLNAVEPRHVHVEQRDSGRVLADHLEGLGSVGGLDHVVAGAAERDRHERAQIWVVVGDQDRVLVRVVHPRPIVRGRITSTRALTLGAMTKTLFVCSQCGNESPKWHGRCPGCGEWNTMVEERAMEAPRGGGGGSSLSRKAAKPARPVPLADVEAPALARFKTGIGELDRVLGGGIVPGSLVLIGGAPG